jgi:hypothetical protein
MMTKQIANPFFSSFFSFHSFPLSYFHFNLFLSLSLHFFYSSSLLSLFILSLLFHTNTNASFHTTTTTTFLHLHTFTHIHIHIIVLFLSIYSSLSQYYPFSFLFFLLFINNNNNYINHIVSQHCCQFNNIISSHQFRSFNFVHPLPLSSSPPLPSSHSCFSHSPFLSSYISLLPSSAISLSLSLSLLSSLLFSSSLLPPSLSLLFINITPLLLFISSLSHSHHSSSHTLPSCLLPLLHYSLPYILSHKQTTTITLHSSTFFSLYTYTYTYILIYIYI